MMAGARGGCGHQSQEKTCYKEQIAQSRAKEQKRSARRPDIFLFGPSSTLPHQSSHEMTPPARKRSPVVELVHNLFDWYPSYLSKEERWFLRKLDCSILTFSTLSYFVMRTFLRWQEIVLPKADRENPVGADLDQSNIQNAFVESRSGCVSLLRTHLAPPAHPSSYVSGMQQKLGLVGNDLNYLSIAYYAAYAAGQVPMLLVQTRPRFTRWFLPSLTVVWAILTFCQSCATKPWHLYLIRALVSSEVALDPVAKLTVVATDRSRGVAVVHGHSLCSWILVPSGGAV